MQKTFDLTTVIYACSSKFVLKIKNHTGKEMLSLLKYPK